MTPEIDKTGLQKVKAIKQKYDIPGIIESIRRDIDLKIALSELVDNAIDETIPGEKTEVIVTFHPDSSTISFVHKNTLGMDPSKMREFLEWGGIYKDDQKIGEHKLGGKLSFLEMCSKEQSKITITSKPPNTSQSHKLQIEDWWNKLDPNVAFFPEVFESSFNEEESHTTFEVRGVRDDFMPSNLGEIAEDLGFRYGVKIQNKNLDIVLLKIRGKKKERIGVLPITIPFRKPEMGKKVIELIKNKSKVQITWGLIDFDIKTQEVKSRKDSYGSTKLSHPLGKRIYYFYQGRLLGEDSLQVLKIPGIDRRIMDSFVVSADVSGWLPKTILKTSFSAQEKNKMLVRIRQIVLKDVTKLIREPEDLKIKDKYLTKTKQATVALVTVLNSMYSNPNEFARDFGIFTKKINLLPKDAEIHPKETKQKSDGTLPGVISPRSHTSKKEQLKTPTLPEIKITIFEEETPDAILAKDENGKPIILINMKHPFIPIVMERTTEKTFLASMLSIAGFVLYQNKLMDEEFSSHEEYVNSVKEGVAQILIRAKDLKII
ncbi:hypothetical protein ACFL1Q_02750 [Patescibacteria group bacterium]